MSGEGEKEPAKKKKGFSKTITLEELRAVFHLPIKEAASKIGVGATVFKEVCRKHNISKWPYRQLHSLNESLEKIKKAAAGRTMDANEREAYRRTVRELEECIDKVMDEVSSAQPSSRGSSGDSGSPSSSEPSLKAKSSNKRTVSDMQSMSPSSSSKGAQANDDNAGGGGASNSTNLAVDKGDENDKQTNVKAASGGGVVRKEKKVRVSTAISNLSISAKGFAENLATGKPRATRRLTAPPAAITTASTSATTSGAPNQSTSSSSSSSSSAPSRPKAITGSGMSTGLSRQIFQYNPSINSTTTGRNHLRRGWFRDEGADPLAITDEELEKLGQLQVQTEVLKDYFPGHRLGKGKGKAGGSSAHEPREYVAHVPGTVQLPPLQCMLESLQSKGTIILAEPQINAEGDVETLQLVPSFALKALL